MWSSGRLDENEWAKETKRLLALEKADEREELEGQLGSLSAEPLPATWRDNAFLHAGARKQQQELLELLAARRDVEKYEAVRRPRTG